MKISKKRKIFIILLTVFFGLNSIYGESSMDNYLPLYDFNEIESESEFEWKGFTDQVMGGVSEISTNIMEIDGERFIRMEGDVSLENNGGFIQIRLKLASGFNIYDASDYDGIRIRVRAIDSGYYLFLRTSNTVFPWKFYKASIASDEMWQSIDIPWSDFEGGDYGKAGRFKPSKLKSIAMVAYGKEFRAQIDLSKIGLYKN